jgi:hypothetical protein
VCACVRVCVGEQDIDRRHMCVCVCVCVGEQNIDKREGFSFVTLSA